MVLPAPVDTLVTSWRIHLRAANLSAKTLENYTTSVAKFTAWCELADITVDPARQTHTDIQTWIGHMLDTGYADATASHHYRGLRQWFRWLAAEGEISADPMLRTRPPKEGEKSVPVFSDDELERLIEACSGREWLDRRDLAIVRFLIDTGARLDELVRLDVDNVDLTTSTALVTGKGNRQRIVPFGVKATQAIDRYMRVRARRPQASSPRLWLGTRGPINSTAIGPMLRVRGRQAGVPGVHPHRFRHTAAHRWLSLGGREQDLMSIAGWKSSQMLQRYGRSAAAERARDAHRQIGPGDRLG